MLMMLQKVSALWKKVQSLILNLKKCLKEGRFEQRKCNSNNKELMDKICLEENENSYEQLHGIKVRVFFRKNIEKKHLYRHDKNLEIKYSCN